MYIPLGRCLTPNGSSSCVDVIYHQFSVSVAPAVMMGSI